MNFNNTLIQPILIAYSILCEGIDFGKFNATQQPSQLYTGSISRLRFLFIMVLASYNQNENFIVKSFFVMQSKDEKKAFLQKVIDITGQ